MKHLIFAALFALIAFPTNALSCIRPNLGADVDAMINSDQTFGLAVGQLSAKQPFKDPNRGTENAIRTPFEVEAEFVGRLIGKSGLSKKQITLPVIAKMGCAGPWCARFPDSSEAQLMFLKKSGKNWDLLMDACPSTVYSEPTKVEINLIARCISRGGCSKTLIKKLDRFPDGPR